MLGCGNFGGIGSVSRVLRPGHDRAGGVPAHGRSLGSRDHDLRHGGRIRRRPQRELHRRVAGDERRDVRDRIVVATKTLNPMEEGQDHGSAGRGSAGRSRRASAVSASSGSPSTSRTTSTPTPRRRRRCRRSASSSRPARSGAIGASNFTGEQLAEAIELSALEGLPRYEWVQNGFSLLDQGDRESVFPLCHAHGLGYTPFSPLAGGGSRASTAVGSRRRPDRG